MTSAVFPYPLSLGRVKTPRLTPQKNKGFHI